MATSVKFLSFSPSTFGGLRPAPNVTETAIIHAAVAADPTPHIDPTPEGLLNKVLKVIETYRGVMLWLEGGVVIMRSDPNTPGVNGYMGWPPIGTKETVLVNDWAAEVEFI